LEDRRFREAVDRFATFWKDNALRPERQERDRAMLRAAGCAGDSLPEIAAWDATQPPEHQRLHAAMEAAVFGMVLHPGDEAQIRAGPAAIAPELGLNEQDAAVLIINRLQAAIENDTL